MKPGLVGMLLLRLLIAWAALMALPASAQAFAPGSLCHAGARLDESFAAVAADPARWTCESRDWSIAPQRVYIRFDLRGMGQVARFETRIARFEALHLTTIERSGRRVSQSFDLDRMIPATGIWRMSAPLPGDRVGAQAVIAAIDRPTSASLLTEAELRPAAPAHPQTWPLIQLAAAAICGLLIGPLLFNLAFYRALREPFLLWQALAVFFMLAHTTLSTGIAHRLTGLPLGMLAPLATLSFSAAAAASSMFSAAFIEPGKIDAVHRRALRITVPWVAVITAIYVAAPEPLRALAPRVFFGGFLPVLGVYAWVMAVPCADAAERRASSWRRGPRSC